MSIAPSYSRAANCDTLESTLADKDFRTISEILYKEAGIVLPASKRSMVYSRLTKRMRSLGMSSFGEYCDLIQSTDGVSERQEFVFALTTNVTSFFREPHHFEILRAEVLPNLIAKAKAGGRVRIWSAGSSNGQEVYSIGVTLLSMMPDALSYDIRILATDIDKNMIEHGRKGEYEASLLDSVPENFRAKFFRSVTGNANVLQAVDSLRKLISFKVLNLIRPWPVKGPFDIIFCRNVVIYFDDPTKHMLWGQFSNVLATDGWMMIGHSERIAGPSADKFICEGHTSYRLRVND